MFNELVMTQPGKILTILLYLSWQVPAGLLLTADVLAIDYQNEYGDEPAPTTIEEVTNLQQQAMLAREKSVPLLIAFSSPWCGYCEALEKEILEPLLKNSEFSNRVIVRKLEVSDYNSVINFAGQAQASVDLAMSMKVDLYPTLAFFNGDGEEISRRLVGITVLEFVSYELEKALAQAHEEL